MALSFPGISSSAKLRRSSCHAARASQTCPDLPECSSSAWTNNWVSEGALCADGDAEHATAEWCHCAHDKSAAGCSPCHEPRWPGTQQQTSATMAPACQTPVSCLQARLPERGLKELVDTEGHEHAVGSSRLGSHERPRLGSHEHPAANQCDDGAGSPNFHKLLQQLAEAHELALAATRRKALSEAGEGSCRDRLDPSSPRPTSECVRQSRRDSKDAPPPRLNRSVTSSSVRSFVPPGRQPAVVHEESPAEEVLKLLRFWDEASTLAHRYSTSLILAGPPLRGLSTDTFVRSPCLQRIVIHPCSIKHFVWDVVSMIFLAYDVIMIPFSLAFVPPALPLTTFINYGSFLFWSLDIAVSMLTGYHDGSDVVLQPTRILKRYLSTWFTADAVLVCIDWVLFRPWDAGTGFAGRVSRSLRVLRFARTLRLIRIFKVNRVLINIQDQINTETLSICYRVVKIVLFLVLANHVLACAWYALGSSGKTLDESGLSTWVVEHNMESLPLAYRYVTSLHWSLTQFTPASMEIAPRNVHERLFAVIVLIFAMVTFSSFVSVLTASITQLRSINSDEARQFWLLRRYLRDWQVSRAFSLRLLRYLEFAYHKQRQRVQARDVKLLDLLSSQLHDELTARTLSAPLVAHPLFLKNTTCLHVFSRSLSEMYLGRGDCVFYCGEQGSSMLFVCTGTLSYHLGEWVGGDDRCGDTPDDCRPQRVGAGQWVAEAVLWTRWLHLGDLQAVTEGQVVCIEATSFGRAVQVHRPSWLAFRTYARCFARAVNRIEQKTLTDLLHVVIPPKDIIDLSSGETGDIVYKSELSQKPPGLFRLSRVLWGGLTAPCAWLCGSREQEEEEHHAFDSVGVCKDLGGGV